MLLTKNLLLTFEEYKTLEKKNYSRIINAKIQYKYLKIVVKKIYSKSL